MNKEALLIKQVLVHVGFHNLRILHIEIQRQHTRWEVELEAILETSNKMMFFQVRYSLLKIIEAASF